MASPRNISRDDAVAALKKIAKTDWNAAGENLTALLLKETDRGVAIIGGSILDDHIANAIRHLKLVKLSAEEDDKLFGPDRPLGSFSARIRMAHALGIIDRDQRKICDLIREMRNACAHSRRSLSFVSKEMSDVIEIAGREILPPEMLKIDDPLVRRLCFATIVMWLVRAIKAGSREAAHEAVRDAFKEGIKPLLEHYASRNKQPEQPSPDHPTAQTE